MSVTPVIPSASSGEESRLNSSGGSGDLCSLTRGDERERMRMERILECFKELASQFLRPKGPYELADLSGQTLTDFPGECFVGSDLRGATLIGDFSGADFRYASLVGADLSRADLRGAKFAQPFDRNSMLSANFPNGHNGAELHGRNFQTLDLRGFSGIVRSTPGARFIDSNLDGVDLSKCCLRGADLRRTDLRNTNLPTDLRGANLSHSDLRGKDLSGADLTGANLSGANLEGATLPKKLVGVNLVRTDLSNVDLSRCDLTGSNLSSCDLRGLDLTTCILKAVTFRGSKLNDSPIELEYTPNDCKRHVRFPGDLHNADFSESDLTNVDLSGSSLAGASFEGATIAETTRLPPSLPHVNFRKAIFVRFNTAQHDFSTANLHLAEFRECEPPASTPGSLSTGASDWSVMLSPLPTPQSSQIDSHADTENRSIQRVSINQRGAWAAINAIVQDPSATYTFFLPRNSTPHHAHQIHAKRVDNDTIALLWLDRETEYTGGYVELGIIIENGEMREINQLRQVINAREDTSFFGFITQDIAQIIVGYHETSGRGPSIHIVNGQHRKIYHTALENNLPGLDRAKAALLNSP